jgi:hypothetical protein
MRKHGFGSCENATEPMLSLYPSRIRAVHCSAVASVIPPHAPYRARKATTAARTDT